MAPRAVPQLNKYLNNLNLGLTNEPNLMIRNIFEHLVRHEEGLGGLDRDRTNRRRRRTLLLPVGQDVLGEAVSQQRKLFGRTQKDRTGFVGQEGEEVDLEDGQDGVQQLPDALQRDVGLKISAEGETCKVRKCQRV